ncbi:Uma2 family endonuclease [bacterium]|nr:Uma2 family endonuclease [bacterium]
MAAPILEKSALDHSTLEGTTEAQLLEQLFRSPRLPVVAEELGARVAAEAARRQQFIDTVLESEKAEFINGEKVVHSPVKFRHNATAKRLLVLLDAHVNVHGLGYVGYEKLMVSLSRNDYEPDICFFNAETAAGFLPEQMRFPAPDLVVEVLSTSTAANERCIKFEDYAAHGVSEYWIIDPDAETVEQYQLSGSTYASPSKPKPANYVAASSPTSLSPSALSSTTPSTARP